MSNYRKNRYIREEWQGKNASYIKQKENGFTVPSHKFDDAIIKLGITWYNMGHLLEEADNDLQKNPSFVSGYNHARTQDIVNERLYSLGKEYFEKDIPLTSIPSNYTSNNYFVRGYNEALRLSLVNKNRGRR